MLRNTLQSLQLIAKNGQFNKFLTTPKSTKTIAKCLSTSTAQPQSQKKE